MITENKEDTWIILNRIIENDERLQLEQYLDGLTTRETALAISRLDEEMRVRLMTMLSPNHAADMLLILPGKQAADLIENIEPVEAANIVELMAADEKADILGQIDPKGAEDILESMSVRDAEETRQILKYPPTSAGGVMTSKYLSFTERLTVEEVIDDLRKNHEQYHNYDIQYAYVTGQNGGLLGVLRMRDLLLSTRNKTIHSLMINNPISISHTASLDDMAQLFEKYSFLGFPVIDEDKRLVGVIQKAEVEEVLGKENRNSYLKMSGIIGGEEYRSMPLFYRSFRRLSWLGPNIILNMIAATVIAFYQDILQAVIVLAIFLPIISDMSGCSGNQAVAVSIRELALGLIKPTEFLRVFSKEALLGCINGLLLGIVLGGIAALWQGNPVLGLVVGCALTMNTLLSVILGGSVPLLLSRFGIDPALASGPILTTVTDLCGFFFLLSFAKLALPFLL